MGSGAATRVLLWFRDLLPRGQAGQLSHCSLQVLQAELEAHQAQVQWVLDSGQSLAASGHPQAQRATEQCHKLEGSWAELQQACVAQAQRLQQAEAVQQVGRQKAAVQGPQASSVGSSNRMSL